MKPEWLKIKDPLWVKMMNMPNGCWVVDYTYDESATSVFVPDINYNEESGEWEKIRQHKRMGKVEKELKKFIAKGQIK